MKKTILITTILLVFLIQIISAAAIDHIISNSEDWKDVYSTILYSNLLGIDHNFLVSERHAPLLLNSIPKNKEIQIISSKDFPYAIGYENMIESKGYPDTEEIESDIINLELANLLTDINNFVIIDDSYGYNAIAVAPYAIQKRAFVLFADRKNIDDIEDFLSGKTIDELLIYGHVDREVKETLSEYDPIQVGEGDRFEDNIAIVQRYRETNPAKQIILSNGEFIEKEIMSGVSPVLFIGKQNVPTVIKDYIQSTDIEVAVLIGNELVGTATNVRRDIGISTFVKFAQGARSPSGSIAAVEGLDLFYLPTYTLSLQIDSIKYNRATKHLEVTYKNNAEVVSYLKGTITLNSDNGETQKVGDIDSVFIDGNDYKTIVYRDISITGDKFTADVFTVYGESKKSLEKAIEGTFEVEIIDVIDNCEVEIEQSLYHKSKQTFFIELKNVGETDCYIDIELIDVLIADESVTLGLEGTEKLESKEMKRFPIPANLNDYDIAKNKFIDVTVYYGQRENSLTKMLKGKFELILAKFLTGADIVFYSVILVAALVILLLIVRRRRKEEEENRRY